MQGKKILKIASKLPVQFYSYFLAVYLMLLCQTLNATEILLTEHEDRISLDGKIGYFIDFKRDFPEQGIINKTHLPRFNMAKSATLSFKEIDTPIWIKIELNNPTKEPIPLTIAINYSWISHIEFYDIDSSGVNKTLTGVNYPHSLRPIDHRSYIFPIEIPPQNTKTLLFHIKSKFFIRLPFSISKPEAFIHDDQIANLVIGSYFGIMLVMFLYNFFLWITIRDIAYFYYIAMIFTSAAYQLNHTGLSSVLMPNAMWWNQYGPMISTPLIVVFIVQFGRKFLNMRGIMPRFDRFMGTIIWIPIILTTIALTPYHIYAQKIVAFFNLTIAFAQLGFGILAYRNGYKPAAYYITAYISFISFTVFIPLYVLGVVPYSGLVHWSFQIGSGLETVLLSLALADRINTLKREKFESVRQIAEANAKSEAKSDFLAKMSHEIRTPMNGVLGMATLLNTTKLNATQKLYTTTIQNSGKALLNVINDVLDLSKIEAKKIKLENIPFNLADIIDECSSIFAGSASEKHVIFLCSTKDNVPNALIGDPARLRQILLNLLSNAFKFTNHGSITLTIAPEDQNDQQTTLKFTVKDTGIGIEPAVQKQLFQSFTQADSSITRRYGGTGLGLTIAKQLSSLMQGKIGVESIPNHGSKFWFTANFMKQQISEKTTKESLKSVHAILITTSQELQNFIEQHANRWEIHLTIINNLKPFEFNEKLSSSPTLLIVDYDLMEAMNQILKTHLEHTKDIPILFIQNFHREEPPEINDNAYLLQPPITTQKFWEKLNAIITDKPNTKEKNSPIFCIKNPKNKNILIAEDNQVNQIVIKGLLKKLGLNPTIVINGKEAVELYQKKPIFSVILMDCEMPILDGYSATQKIREFERENKLEPTPIIALTAHALQEHREKSLQSGMNAHLSKPIIANELIKTLSTWMN